MISDRPGWTRKIVRWFSDLQVASVATQSLTAGMLLSAMESSGRIDWGHETLLLANVPIIAWAVARWWVGHD
jgi:hypothetical protein